MENSVATSPVGSVNQDGVSSERLRRYEIIQEKGALSCKYCNHRTDHKRKLKMHEEHHSANLPFRCRFCTFSSQDSRSLRYHTNRVHLEQNKKRNVLDDRTRAQVNGEMMLQGDEKEALKVGISVEEHPMDLLTPRKRTNDIPPSGEEVRMIDITTDSDGEEFVDGEMIKPLDLSLGGQIDPRTPDEHVPTSTKPLSRSSESMDEIRHFFSVTIANIFSFTQFAGYFPTFLFNRRRHLQVPEWTKPTD